MEPNKNCIGWLKLESMLHAPGFLEHCVAVSWVGGLIKLFSAYWSCKDFCLLAPVGTALRPFGHIGVSAPAAGGKTAHRKMLEEPLAHSSPLVLQRPEYLPISF